MKKMVVVLFGLALALGCNETTVIVNGGDGGTGGGSGSTGDGGSGGVGAQAGFGGSAGEGGSAGSGGMGGDAGSGGSGGEGGSGGMGGEGGNGGELVDECVSEPDSGYVQSGALSTAAQICGQGTCLTHTVKLIGGSATEEDVAEAVECIGDCVLEDSNVEGVSTGCAQCFANSSACGAIAQCNVCIVPDSCSCVDCLEGSGCQEEIDICAGVIREFECTP